MPARTTGRNRSGPFNPNSTFGHTHAGPAEWWIVQVGAITGKFENMNPSGCGSFKMTTG